MKALWRIAGYTLSVLALGMIVLAGATARPGNPALWPPAPGAPTFDVFLISNGYHTGIAIPHAPLADFARQNGNAALATVAERFSGYPYVEIGWGEEQFYAAVPTVAHMTFGLAVKALFWPANASVLHVVGLQDEPRQVFRSADIVPVKLSEAGFAAMVKAIDGTFERSGAPPVPQVLGKGLYGPSLFYRAQRRFHIFNVCNHWAADMLSAAGLPATPVLDTVPAGMLFDLKTRAGLEPMPKPQPSQQP